ncbi:precorrin-2 C(20)-methyltransferase [Pararhizobium mangrovi]|uniref:Precorrin-2 C(20)-methyltransferase n=1 Tax=Pararhizobium mangrovi TaxID=2590452 RepID=A0A506UA28_9HYPH|nr:precorrin-2 C(20)-methyltransferase [Pararhizobium mangrovi]TPW31292.1 precorrin-2 C(20)-methyltransferase [Pararhizobium mangrovi]
MTGTLYGLGLGPGDPELVTMKAHRLLKAVSVIAYPAPDHGTSFARSIAAEYLPGTQKEIPIVVPMRVERFPARAVYDTAAAEIAGHLDASEDVAVLCEGDPFFYGSFMYLFERLARRFPCEIVPGVSSIMAGAASMRRPIAARNDVFSVIPAPLETPAIERRLDACDAAAIIKIGRHFARIRDILERRGLMASAGYIERIGLANERILPLAQIDPEQVPYFSLALVYRGAEKWIADRAADANAEGART